MTMQQPEALRLADKYEAHGFVGDHRFTKEQWCSQAAVELRRLHAENQELKEQMAAIGAGGVEPLRKSASQQAEAIQSMGGKYRVRWKHKNGQWSFWTSLGGGLKLGDVEVELVEAESPGDLVRSIRDYLGVHDGIKLGGHAMDDMALDLARIALRFQHLVAPPADPMDWPLPCDVTVGHGTMRKGVALRTLVLRMKVLYEMATGQNADEVAARTPEQRAELLSAFQAKIAPQAVQAAAHPAEGATAQAVKLLAADHSGMKVDYRGLFYQVQRALKRTDPGHAEMLRQLEGHLQELGQRWYAGDTAVVDELLQLYSVECQARDALAAQAEQGGDHG